LALWINGQNNLWADGADTPVAGKAIARLDHIFLTKARAQGRPVVLSVSTVLVTCNLNHILTRADIGA